ncbi:MAG: glycosyltransferase family 2 protein [Planctomycetota bacterium]
MNPRAVHVVVCTHTTRWLAECLAGLAQQRVRATSVIVSCDNEDEGIRGVVARCARDYDMEIRLVQREHAGVARLNQVRNNGLRALQSDVGVGDHDQVVVMDGDVVLDVEAIGQHADLAARFGMVIPFRIDVSEQRSKGVAAAGIIDGSEVFEIGDTDRKRLAERQRRYERELAMKLWPLVGGVLVKAHKPKVLGGHHAVRWSVLKAVNGYDEAYQGYGYDDDDLSRRVHALRPRVEVGIAVNSVMAFHLWHPTRASSGGPKATSGYERFMQVDWSSRTLHGLESPIDQAQVRVITNP